MPRVPFSIKAARVRAQYVHDPVVALVGRHSRVECYVMEDSEITLTNMLRRLKCTTRVTPFTETQAAFRKWPSDSGGMLAHSNIVYSRKYRRGSTVAFIHDGTGQPARTMRELAVGINAACAAKVGKILVFANVSSGAGGGQGRRGRDGELLFTGGALVFERLLVENIPAGYAAETVLLPHYQQKRGVGRMMGPVWAVIEKV